MQQEKNSPLAISSSVRDALGQNRPVVGLESSIIAHGLPYPHNLDTALEIERKVRECGAVPATIGILAGQIRIGLEQDELHQLATDEHVVKVGYSDLPYATLKHLMGGTTVSATLVCSEMAGIKVVATGGIGGIHRDYDQTHDESRDLQQLALSDTIVVCSGVKAILDIPRTLQRLDTLGVGVVTLGQDAFPAFWSRQSGCQSPMRLDGISEIVDMYRTKWNLGISGGLLIANPVPQEHEIALDDVERWIKQAMTELHQGTVTGKQVTPYLLDRIYALSNGTSVRTNRHLVVDNAKVAAMIARELAGSTA